MTRVWHLIGIHPPPLILGAVAALVWANLAPDSYAAFRDTVLVADFFIGEARADAAADSRFGRTLTLGYLVNDVLMSLFFALAAKEVWEAIVLKDGAPRGRRALTPLFATAGGIAGPVAVYLGLAGMLGYDVWDAVARGWAIPTATDIAFSYLVGRAVFGAGHPAVQFLLLLAIADDAAGMAIIALAYPSGQLEPGWLALSVAAPLVAYLIFNRLPRRPAHRRASRSLGVMPYAVAGCLSWYGFQESGLHPALGLLPVIPAIPHAAHGFGMFAPAEARLPDLLNVLARRLRPPVRTVLFLFGLMNAGVLLTSIGDATWLVLDGLMVGKPAGIFVAGWLAARPLGMGLPDGMSCRDLAVLGMAAAVGFTVSLFLAGAALQPGPVHDAARMGALLSFAAAALAMVLGRLLGVRRRP